MSTLKIENAALKEAVRKCSVSEKDTITLFVTEKKSGDKNIAQLKTCNGNMQTSALVLVEIDTKGGETFIFPSALFSSSVSTLGTYADDDFELTVTENGGFSSISCGSASVDIPLLSEAISIEMADAKKEKYAYTKFSSVALKEAFSIGSVAMDKECCQKAAANAVDVAPVSGNDGEKMLRICALNENCSMISVAYVPVLQEKGLDDLLGKREYVLNALFCKIISAIKSDEVEILMFERQVIVRDGLDFYIIVPNAAKYPDVLKVLQEIQPDYSATVSKDKLTGAINVSLLGKEEKDDLKILLVVDDNKLNVSSISNEGNHADIEAADCSGQIKIGVDGSLLRRAAVRLSDTVIISGNGAKDLIHLKSPNIDGSVNICPVNLQAKDCAENVSEK